MTSSNTVNTPSNRRGERAFY